MVTNIIVDFYVVDSGFSSVSKADQVEHILAVISENDRQETTENVPDVVALRRKIHDPSLSMEQRAKYLEKLKVAIDANKRN